MSDHSTTQAYLHRHIPLSAAMGVEVVRADTGGVVLTAPLGPNLNHEASGFGGSISALAILAGWTLLHVTVGADVEGARIVIQRSEIDFISPATGRLEARCPPAAAEPWERFCESVARKGRGRVRLGSSVESEGELCALFRGQYAVLN